MQFKKAMLATAIVVATSASANEIDIRSYAANQATALPAVGSYDGFIVYLKENSNGARVTAQSVEQTLSSVNDVKVTRTLATGGLVVKSAADLGIFRTSANGTNYQATQDANIFQELLAHPDVELVEPNLIMKATMTPNDSDYSRLWGLNSTQYGINVEGAWDTYRGQGVTVAVIDTGIVRHSDLNANIRGGYDFISPTRISQDGNGRDSDPTDVGDWYYTTECDPDAARRVFRSSSWHGTHVAGTIAMVGNNRNGGIGVAPEATVVPVRVLGKCGGTSADIADAIVWSAGGSVDGVPANRNPAQVINMSLGGPSRSCPYTYQRAINSAVNNGATVVIAAGNSNRNVSGFTPANCNNTVTVAALGASGNRAAYSNYGSLIDVAAPGGDQQSAGTSTAGIYSTVDRGERGSIGEGYTYMDGTSMASPHVAGVAALVKQKFPNATPAEVERRLKEGARPIPGTCSLGCGEGIVDVGRTLNVTDENPPVGNVLEKGKAVSIASLPKGQELVFTVNVPSGVKNLVIKTSGGTGDVDMKVQHSSSSYPDCRRAAYGNNETCTFATPKSGKYTVTLTAYSASRNFSVIADYEKSGDDNGGGKTYEVTGTINSGKEGFTDAFKVSAGRITAEMVTKSSTSDLDLYLQMQSSSGSWRNVASSLKPAGSKENISYNAAAGTYRWRVKSYRGGSEITLTYTLP